MNALLRHWILIALCLFAVRTVPAAGPRTVQTANGTYEIFEFLKLPDGSIELSNDGKFLLLEERAQILCFELPNLEKPVGTLYPKQPGNWKQIDDKLIVAGVNCWTTHAIPSLIEEQTTSPSAAFTSAFSQSDAQVPQAVDEGWLHHGLLFNPNGTKVIGTMRGWSKGRWVDLSHEMEMSVYPSQKPVASKTMARKRFARIPGLTDCVDFTPDGFHLFGTDRLPYPMATNTQVQDIRCGQGWFSARLKRDEPTTEPFHVLVKVISHAGRKSTRQFGLFSLAQPTLLLDSKATFQHPTTEGDSIDNPQIVTWPRIHGSTLKMMDLDKKDGPIREPIHWLFNDWSQFHGSLSPPDTIEALRKGLQKYIERAKVEFEAATGQPATEVPISIHVGIKQGERRHEYFVWTQISEDELICSFGTDFLNSLIENEYQAKVNAQKRVVHEKQDVQRNAQNQSVVIARENRITQAKADLKATRTLFIASSVISLFIGIGCLIGVCVLGYRLRNLAILLLAVLIPSQLYAQKTNDKNSSDKSTKQPATKPQSDKANKSPNKSPNKSSKPKASGPKIPGISAPESWTIKTGDEFISQVASVQLSGSNHQLKFGYHSGKALLRYDSDKGQPMLAAIDLNQPRAIAQADYPNEWDWHSTIVCNQYAACANGSKLLLLDTNTCKIVKEVALPRTGKLVILFDKALWIEPDTWFALPSLKPVLQHPIVDPGAMNRWLCDDNAPPYMLDANLCVIEGVEFDSNLRETGRFFGHTQNMDPALWTFPIRMHVDQREAKDSPSEWYINGYLSNVEWKTLAKMPTGQQLVADSPESFTVPKATENMFSVYDSGLWCLYDGWLIVLHPEKKYKGLARHRYPMFPTPFVEAKPGSFEVPITRIDGEIWQYPSELLPSCLHSFFLAACNPRKKSDHALLSQLDMRSALTAGGPDSETRFGINRDLTIPRDFLGHMEVPLALGNCVLEQIIMWSGAPPDATWPELLKAYREQCAHWTKFAPDALREREDLIPVEMAFHATYANAVRNRSWASVVLYFPEPLLKQLFDKLQTRESNMKELFMMPAKDLPQEIALFEKRDRAAVIPKPKEFVPEVAEPEPTPAKERAAPPPPQIIVNPTPRPSLSLLVQVVTMPVAIAMRALFLWCAVYMVNRGIQRKADKITFPGGWHALILVAVTWITLEFAINNGFAALAFYLVGANFVIRLVVFCFNLMISLSVILLLVNILSDPENEHMNSVALRAFGCVAALSIPSLPLLLIA